jgi:hypothetical protein
MFLIADEVIKFKGSWKVFKVMSVLFLKARGCIHNTLFSSQFTNQPDKLEWLIKLGWKGLPITNALTYLAYL